MKYFKTLYLLLVTQTVLILGSCAGGDYSKDLSGGYFYRAEGENINDILSHMANGKEIPANVLSYDYNSNFIIASQKPKAINDPLYDSNPEYPNGRDEIYYWLIVHSDKLVLGPMNRQNFNLALKKYNVPNNLKLNLEK